jgi:hypothetical protein
MINELKQILENIQLKSHYNSDKKIFTEQEIIEFVNFLNEKKLKQEQENTNE